MKECVFEDAMTEAEKACAGSVAQLFDRVKTYRGTNPGDPDCQVFDIGHLHIGENTTFNSAAYCYRAQLDLYRRDRTALQRDIMRILQALPIGADNNAEAELRETSNVLNFRVAPEPNAVTSITTTDVSPDKDAKQIPCWTATVVFDVVFVARF